MPVSVDYVVRETASNLWRNRLMTIAAVLTVAVSLSLVGRRPAAAPGVGQRHRDLERGTQVTVWMEPDANAQEITAVKTELAQLNYVASPAPTGTRRGTSPRPASSCPPTSSRPPPRPRCPPPSGAPRLP